MNIVPISFNLIFIQLCIVQRLVDVYLAFVYSLNYTVLSQKVSGKRQERSGKRIFHLGEDIHGCTPLFYAVTLCHADACQMLLDLKANPNHRDRRGRTQVTTISCRFELCLRVCSSPSHCAALKGTLDCLKRLLASHADIWMKNKHGDYPIHEAILSFSKLHHPPEDRSQLKTGYLGKRNIVFTSITSHHRCRCRSIYFSIVSSTHQHSKR